MQTAFSETMHGVAARAAMGTTESDDVACSYFQTDQLSMPGLGLPSTNAPRMCHHHIHNPSNGNGSVLSGDGQVMSV